MRQKNDSLFIYDNPSNFSHNSSILLQYHSILSEYPIHAWGIFDRSIKVTPSTIKVTPFDGTSSKKVIITYGKGIELKANYCTFSSWGLCDVAYFQNFQKNLQNRSKLPRFTVRHIYHTLMSFFHFFHSLYMLVVFLKKI